MSEFSNKNKKKNDLTHRNISLRRVSKVVKGGKRFSFSSLVVVGDEKGRIGYAMGKAKDVSGAMKKAEDLASRTLWRFPLKEGRTIHGDVQAKFGGTKVVIRSAPQGKGVIAGGAMRSIFEVIGIKDVVAKTIGSTNPHSVVRATLKALGDTEPPRAVALKRGKKLSDLFDSVSKESRGEESEENSTPSM